MNSIKTTPHTVVAVCTGRWGKLWVDGKPVPTTTAFALECNANDHPRFKLNADIASITLPDDFVMDTASAKAVLACISARDLIEALQERGYTITEIAEPHTELEHP